MNDSTQPIIWLVKAPRDGKKYAKVFGTEARIFYVPTSKFTNCNFDEGANKLLDPSYCAVVITSPRAASAIVSLIEQSSDVQKAKIEKVCRNRALFSVGTGSDTALTVQFGERISSSGGATELSKKIIDWWCRKNQVVFNGGSSNLPLQHKSKILFFCGSKRLDILPKDIELHHVPLDEVIIYQSVLMKPPTLPNSAPPQWIVFFSPSGIESFLEKYPPTHSFWETVKIVSIGPTTAAAFKRLLGFNVTKVSEKPTPGCLKNCVCNS